MNKNFSFLLVAISLTGHSALAETRTVNLALGASVPASDSANGIEKKSDVPGGDLTRRSGGEVLGLVFMDPTPRKAKEIKQEVQAIRLIGYSASGKGKVLIRRVESRPQISDDFFNPLSRFSKIQAGSHAQNRDGLVMLGQGDEVTFTLTKPISASRVLLILEAFGNSDASVDIQLLLTRDGHELGIGFKRLVVADFEEQQSNQNSGGSSDNSNDQEHNTPSEKPHDSTPGSIHSGSCLSHGSNGQCDTWSGSGGTTSCLSHGSNGDCDTWSGSGGTTSCLSHGTNGQCDTWSGSGGTTSCLSHGTNGQCDTWSGSGGTVSCLSHGSQGQCDTWSDGRTCLSHSMNGDCSTWSK
ncbi:MAG: hypothetical protein ACXWQO_13545 [Bdellovibrionota bacterium]